MKRFVTAVAAVVCLAGGAAFAQAAPEGDPHGREERRMARGGGHGIGRGVIPPHLAQKLGIPKETQQRIQQMALEANEQLISLDADLKRGRLELQKQLMQDRPDQRAVMALVDKIARAEAEVRKNRLGLMLKVREVLGPDLWHKLQAEMPRGKGRKGRK